MTSRLLATLTGSIVALALMAGPAAAQPQTGLINVDVSNNTVQVPIAIAANLCGLQVGALASGLVQNQEVDCKSNADATADSVTSGGGGGGGPQNGLVNVAITDNVIQVPVGVAANICGVQAAVLTALTLQNQDVTCDAVGNSDADSDA